MKRTFPLHVPGKHDDRVRDKIRHEVNKHVRKQTGKPLPKGFGSWEFTCRVGASAATAEARTVKEVAAAIDAVALTGAAGVYVEIAASPVVRRPPVAAPSAAGSPGTPAAPSPEG
ncbi:MAG: hypothetical protein HY302_11185 [Opitutae bacterium]|nr:hypothetical protein [Opitutae bacterium]